MRYKESADFKSNKLLLNYIRISKYVKMLI